MEMKCKYVVYRAKQKNTANIATFQLNTDDTRLDEFGRSANVSLKSSPSPRSIQTYSSVRCIKSSQQQQKKYINIPGKDQ